MSYSFSFDLAELPNFVLDLLSEWSVWQRVRDELTELTSSNEALDLLLDMGYFEQLSEF
jgi:hypothetical protein